MKNRWYNAVGSDRDVVLSTRVRLARNLSGWPFPASMTEEQRGKLIETVAPILEASGLVRQPWSELPLRERQALVERHLVSPSFASHEGTQAVFALPDESVSVSVAGRDGLSLQALAPGLALEEAYRRIDELDTAWDRALSFAFDSRLGYLTQSPADLGTAMHASLYLHLPALQQSRFIYELTGMVSKLGLSLQSVYSEGRRGDGAVYQLSNRVTLGISEQAAILNLASIAQQIIKQERAAREEWAQQATFADRAWRSWGVLKTARLLSQEELLSFWSSVRVGVAQGCLTELALPALDALLLEAQNASIMSEAGADLEPAERDKERANFIRERV